MRRGAIIPISEQFLETMLKLPPGSRIRAFCDNNTRMSIDVYVEGPAFPEVPEGTMPSVVNPVYVSVSPYYSMVPLDGDTPIYDEVCNDLRAV